MTESNLDINGTPPDFKESKLTLTKRYLQNNCSRLLGELWGDGFKTIDNGVMMLEPNKDRRNYHTSNRTTAFWYVQLYFVRGCVYTAWAPNDVKTIILDFDGTTITSAQNYCFSSISSFEVLPTITTWPNTLMVDSIPNLIFSKDETCKPNDVKILLYSFGPDT